jgi:hypothetical protein
VCTAAFRAGFRLKHQAEKSMACPSGTAGTRRLGSGRWGRPELSRGLAPLLTAESKRRSDSAFIGLRGRCVRVIPGGADRRLGCRSIIGVIGRRHSTQCGPSVRRTVWPAHEIVTHDMQRQRAISEHRPCSVAPEHRVGAERLSWWNHENGCMAYSIHKGLLGSS